MAELDEAFQQTVSRAVTPWKEADGTDLPNPDVSVRSAKLMPGPKPYLPNQTRLLLAHLQRRPRNLYSDLEWSSRNETPG